MESVETTASSGNVSTSQHLCINNLAKRGYLLAKRGADGWRCLNLSYGCNWTQVKVVYKGKLNHMIRLVIPQGFSPLDYQVYARGLEHGILSQKCLVGSNRRAAWEAQFDMRIKP